MSRQEDIGAVEAPTAETPPPGGPPGAPTKKKKRHISAFQLQYPELFRSDSSIYPSYTNLKVPYEVVCRLRIGRVRREYEKRFQKEVNSLALQQTCAWDGVRVARIFTDGIRIKPSKDPLAPRERQRLNSILEKRGAF